MLDEGAETFGEAARDRYAALILRAMQDVAENPKRPGVKPDPNVDPTALFYHLKHSRDRVAPHAARVGKPRHILVFEIGENDVVNILGLIPDMIPFEVALPRYVPER